MSLRDRFLKRSLDLGLAITGLLIIWPVIVISWVIARHDTGASGLFRQTRIGRLGKPFHVIKLRTMRAETGTSITTSQDKRITPWGAFFRRWKIDELPQLWNVLWGDMSFVGPRPDVPGYMDKLHIDDRRLLNLRPGITGPASLKYRHEEQILANQQDPQAYNDTVIWPDKVRINLAYYDTWSLKADLVYIFWTLKA